MFKFKFAHLLPATTVYAHCDLPCGVYDPAQALIEAKSVYAIMTKYATSEDPVFRMRSIIIKEQRAELVKHHLWVLWTDYFKPEHLEQHPQLHDLIWRTTKQAGLAKHSVDPAEGKKLLELIGEISDIFAATRAHTTAPATPAPALAPADSAPAPADPVATK